MRVAVCDAFLAERIPWREAEWALRRSRHTPTELRSLNSLGPLKSWCCDVCAEMGQGRVEYTTALVPPYCDGRSG